MIATVQAIAANAIPKKMPDTTYIDCIMRHISL